MWGEVSYFSRFFVKFVEIVAAGLASAVSAYLLAHFGGLLLSSSTPASAPAPTAVQLGPTASEVAKSLRAQPSPPVAAAAVNEQRPAPQQDTDAPIAQPALRAVKDANAWPPREHAKTDASVAEKRPPGQKSAEALARARAALANVDANRPASAAALVGPGLTDTRPAPVDVQPPQADQPPRQAARPRPMPGRGRATFRPALPPSRRRRKPPTFSRSRRSLVRRPAPTCSGVHRTSSPVG